MCSSNPSKTSTSPSGSTRATTATSTCESSKDGGDIHLNADLLASAGDDWNGTGSGYIRLVAPDGSITNDNDMLIKGTNAHLIAKAFDTVGTVAAPLLTEVGSLTAATSAEGVGNVVVIEADDLILTSTDSYGSLVNYGLIIPNLAELPKWVTTVTWDDDATTDWLNQVRDGNDVYAVTSGTGDIDVTLLGQDALLTLQSGKIESRAAGKTTFLTADDFDFTSGENMIVGPGVLDIRSTHDEINYRLGSAGENVSAKINRRSRATARRISEFATLPPWAMISRRC